MANFKQVTLNMEAATGYVVSLGQCKSISMLARGACLVQLVNAENAPTAPTVTPAPAASATAAYLDMQAGETQSMGVEDVHLPNEADSFNYLVVWCVGAGNLVCNAH